VGDLLFKSLSVAKEEEFVDGFTTNGWLSEGTEDADVNVGPLRVCVHAR
jgi:hypothetical protein